MIANATMALLAGAGGEPAAAGTPAGPAAARVPLRAPFGAVLRQAAGGNALPAGGNVLPPPASADGDAAAAQQRGAALAALTPPPGEAAAGPDGPAAPEPSPLLVPGELPGVVRPTPPRVTAAIAAPAAAVAPQTQAVAHTAAIAWQNGAPAAVDPAIDAGARSTIAGRTGPGVASTGIPAPLAAPVAGPRPAPVPPSPAPVPAAAVPTGDVPLQWPLPPALQTAGPDAANPKRAAFDSQRILAAATALAGAEPHSATADGWRLDGLATLRAPAVPGAVSPPPVALLEPATAAPRLGERVVVMVAESVKRAEIRVSPAELGPLRIDVDQRDGLTSVTFSAQHAQTRELLEAALPRLREFLQGAGLTLGEASVEQQGERADGSEAGEPAESSPAEPAPGEAAATPVTAVTPARRGLIDTFV